MNKNRALGLMLFCLLTAALLRLPSLSEIPPGPHHDEAAYGISAGDIGLRGERPVFITSYTGREVFFLYLAGGLARLLGNSLFALRLTSAFIGLLTVAAVYWLGLELFRDRRVALLAAALLAISFWHLIFSRLGFRAISQPLLQALAVAALFRGLRRDEWRWLALAGLGWGLTGYTYLAARLFPIPLALTAVPFLLERNNFQRRLGQFAFTAVTALIVLAPLLNFFIHHPDAFWVRIGQVAPAASMSLAESYGRSLAMLFVSGDPYWRFNLPGRPLFNWFWGGLLLWGWLQLLWRWRRPEPTWRRAASLLLIVTPLLMVLPTALATGEIVPSNLRAIGLIPFIFYLPAIGLVALARAAVEQACTERSRSGSKFVWRKIEAGKSVTAVILLILVAGAFFTGRSYFQTWATRTDLYYDSDADLAAVADFLDEMDIAGKSVYIAAQHYRHPTVAFLSRHYDAVKWLPHSQALVWPETGPSLIIFPQSSPAPEWALPYLSLAQQHQGPPGPDGLPVFVAYEWTERVDFSPGQPSSANFGQAMTLLGYDVGSAAVGETLPLTLYWRVTAHPPADFIPFVHLEDGWRYRWSQIETFAYPSEQWTPGETIVQRVALPIRPGTPPGLYRLRVGLFDPASGGRLAHLDEAGRYAGDAFVIEGNRVLPGAPPALTPQPPITLAQPIPPNLQLLGYERGGPAVATGDTYWLALWWQATGPLSPMTARLELMRSDNVGHILSNNQPVHNSYPFNTWTTPQFLIDHVSPKIPASFPPGDYRLQLRLLDGADQTLLTADLGPLRVEATDRVFESPRVMYPHAAVFGNEVRLRGYDLEQISASQFNLSLVWQALVTPSADYTIFVHLLDPQGVCCVWQQDVMPRQGHYPTGRWLPEEVVRDTYEIQLPDDLDTAVYPLEIGLYMADTGQRLLVHVPGLPANDALHLRPLTVE